jgi:hypothetical protein
MFYRWIQNFRDIHFFIPFLPNSSLISQISSNSKAHHSISWGSLVQRFRLSLISKVGINPISNDQFRFNTTPSLHFPIISNVIQKSSNLNEKWHRDHLEKSQNRLTPSYLNTQSLRLTIPLFLDHNLFIFEASHHIFSHIPPPHQISLFYRTFIH